MLTSVDILKSTWLGEELMELGEKKGIEKGIEKGLEKGIEKGRAQGVGLGLLQGIHEAADLRFPGKLDLSALADLHDPTQLGRILRAVIAAKSAAVAQRQIRALAR